jgi:predicted nuclease with TOPRIM domain
MPLQYHKAVSWSKTMSEKSNPDASLHNDVQVIRNILFGEHLDKIQKQMDVLEKELAALRKENKALWNEVKNASEQRFQELTARLEQSKNEQGQLEKALRQDLEVQIKEVSKRLLTHEEHQGGLISSLAEALMKQNRIAGG